MKYIGLFDTPRLGEYRSFPFRPRWEYPPQLGIVHEPGTFIVRIVLSFYPVERRQSGYLAQADPQPLGGFAHGYPFVLNFIMLCH